ncbi:MAG: helix-turn-helix domain-containing protein [Solirubrobacteraceae bacterium]
MTEIGATLREARLRAGADITDVELATKIRAKYLRALENEEWDLLPGPTFVKSFLRTYAEYLGLDGRLLVEEFRRRQERPAAGDLPPLRPTRRSERDRPRGQAPFSPRAGAIAILVLAVIAAFYALGTWGKDSPSNDKTASSSSASTPARSHSPRKKRQGAAPARRPSKNVRLQIVPTGAVYVCLIDGKGKRLIPGATLAAGRASRTFTAPKLLLGLGNSQAKLRIDGKTVGVPGRAVPIGYLVTPRGHKLLAAAQRPRCA